MKVSFSDRKHELFEASKVLDDANAKMIEARHERRPFFFAIGKKHQSKDASTEASAASDRETEKRFDWQFLFNPSVIPGFMEIDQFRSLAALVASVSSGKGIEVDQSAFTPTTSYGGADVRWELTQNISKYLTSIECTGFALDEGPEVEYSTSAPIAQIYFSLRNASLKKMQIASMVVSVVYTELELNETGLCGVVISQIEFDQEKPAPDPNRDIETLEKKLETGFVGILNEFVRKNINRAS
jgi:hypothetical protein